MCNFVIWYDKDFKKALFVYKKLYLYYYLHYIIYLGAYHSTLKE